MAENPPITAVMTPYPYFIDSGASLNSAKAMMAQMRIHHLPVKQDGRLVSVLSERDIQRAETLGVDTSAGGATRVQDICHQAAYVVGPQEPLKTVLLTLAEKHLDSVLVVEGKGESEKLLGIFTVTDACRCYAETL